MHAGKYRSDVERGAAWLLRHARGDAGEETGAAAVRRHGGRTLVFINCIFAAPQVIWLGGVRAANDMDPR